MDKQQAIEPLRRDFLKTSMTVATGAMALGGLQLVQSTTPPEATSSRLAWSVAALAGLERHSTP